MRTSRGAGARSGMTGAGGGADVAALSVSPATVRTVTAASLTAEVGRVSAGGARRRGGNGSSRREAALARRQVTSQDFDFAPEAVQ